MKKLRVLMCYWGLVLLGCFFVTSNALAETLFYTSLNAKMRPETFRIADNGKGKKMVANNAFHTLEAVDRRESIILISIHLPSENDSIWSYSFRSNAWKKLSNYMRTTFITYNAASKRVIYATDYDPIKKTGDFYSVSIQGISTTVLLAEDAQWGDIHKDRLIYHVNNVVGNRDIYSVRLNGSGRTALDRRYRHDKIYKAMVGDKVVYSLLFYGNESDHDILAIPYSGGRRTYLASSPDNELYDGANQDSVFYKNGSSLYSISINGGNPVLFGQSQGEGYQLTCSYRIVYQAGNSLKSERKYSGDVITFQGIPWRFWGFTAVLKNRVVYNHGSEFGQEVNSARADGTYFRMILGPQPSGVNREIKIDDRIARYEKVIVTDIRRTTNSTTITACKVDRSQNTVIYQGDKKGKYLFQTWYYYIYAVRDRPNNLWTLYSKNKRWGGSPIKLDTDITEDGLDHVFLYSYY